MNKPIGIRELKKGDSNLKTKTRENSGDIIGGYVVDDIDKILSGCEFITL